MGIFFIFWFEATGKKWEIKQNIQSIRCKIRKANLYNYTSFLTKLGGEGGVEIKGNPLPPTNLEVHLMLKLKTPCS